MIGCLVFHLSESLPYASFSSSLFHFIWNMSQVSISLSGNELEASWFHLWSLLTPQQIIPLTLWPPSHQLPLCWLLTIWILGWEFRSELSSQYHTQFSLMHPGGGGVFMISRLYHILIGTWCCGQWWRITLLYYGDLESSKYLCCLACLHYLANKKLS